jgi:hypothetical protein
MNFPKQVAFTGKQKWLVVEQDADHEDKTQTGKHEK